MSHETEHSETIDRLLRSGGVDLAGLGRTVWPAVMWGSKVRIAVLTAALFMALC